MTRTEIESLLPGVFQRTLHPDNPLWALVGVMEALHAPSEQVLGRLDAVCDPRRTPDAFVPFLARWVDLDRIFGHAPGRGARREPITSGLGALRELIASAAFLSQWRGTGPGLTRFLEIATGAPGFAIDEAVAGDDGLPRPFHIRVRAPALVRAHEALIDWIISLEKPAYVTHELVFEDPEAGGT